jgi:hypothetical protein
MTAMTPRRRRGVWSELVYIDLLAGPGLGIDRKTGAALDDLIPGWRDLKRARVAAGERLTAEEIASHDQPFVTLLLRRMGELGFLYSGQGEPYFTNEKTSKCITSSFFRSIRQD